MNIQFTMVKMKANKYIYVTCITLKVIIIFQTHMLKIPVM